MDHICHISTVLERVLQTKITAKPWKCQFGMRDCAFLGHVVEGGKLKPRSAQVADAALFPIPEIKKQVHIF